ncbi:MAG: hypothetical protein KIT33_09730 [Candidatus Kapabacteria bacterium]|nr:hypothetical protein [Ignavibacteriota bacterium]MCW5885237.1 hypothetical protein [Candidatus Kapabacteria bacterium]
MKLVLNIVIFLVIYPNFIISFGYEKYFDDSNRLILLGQCSVNDWFSETGWNIVAAESYQTDKIQIDRIKELVNTGDISFVIIAGSWCGDTKSELPKLIKIFDECNIDSVQYRIIGVGRDKKITDTDIDNIEIKLVPTLLIYKELELVGKIEEFPEYSWEQDIVIVLEE